MTVHFSSLLHEHYPHHYKHFFFYNVMIAAENPDVSL